MTCQDRQDQIVSYALGSLGGPEREELLAHLAGCRECTEYLAGVTGVVDALPLALEPVSPPPQLRKRLIERTSGPARAPQPPPALVPPRTRTRWQSFWPAALAGGAVAAAIAVGVFWIEFDGQRQTVASLRADVVQLQDQVKQLRAQLDQTNQSIHLFESPAVQLVSLEGAPTRPQARGRVFWDRDRDALHFFASGLKPLPAGKTYQLWIISADQKKIPVATFAVSPQGEASLVTPRPSDARRIAALAVTDEPAGGSPQPTGHIQLSGQSG